MHNGGQSYLIKNERLSSIRKPRTWTSYLFFFLLASDAAEQEEYVWERALIRFLAYSNHRSDRRALWITRQENASAVKSNQVHGALYFTQFLLAGSITPGA